MRRHQYRWSVFLLAILLEGCSTTGGLRFFSSRTSDSTQSKSIAVVGDRPLPTATGDPGEQVVADAREPEPRRSPKNRISGRVVDDQGDPVPNVTVRLADGGAKGGKDIRGTTDKSGAFTLNGLRPGSTYSLIAETEDDRGPLTGRTTAQTAETGVEISLVGEESEAKSSTQRSARPTRVRPVSNREESGEEPVADEAPAVNREDILPLTNGSESVTLDPGPTPPSKAGRPQLSPPQSAVGWQNSKSKSAKVARTDDDEAENAASTTDGKRRRPRVMRPVPEADDEDGPNPLPPAIEPDDADAPSKDKSTSARTIPAAKVGARNPKKNEGSGEIALIPEPSNFEKLEELEPSTSSLTESSINTDFRPISSLVPDEETTRSIRPRSIEIAAEEPSGGSGPLPLPPIGDPVMTIDSPRPTISPPAGPSATSSPDASNPASQPVFASQPLANPTTPSPAPHAEYNPFVLAAATPPVPERMTAPPATDSQTSAPSKLVATAEDSPAEVDAPRRKWGELAAKEKAPIVVEPTKATVSNSFMKRFRPTVEKRETSVALCSYNTRLRKLNDFRLPDLEGKPVRFQDFDADFVLLDFWGTWCAPCLDSIPHLIELQKKYGPSRLKVVGIACEEGPTATRKSKVEEASRKLGINYAVLLSTMDGKPCPVQQALQIQAMPTLILVDRRGQIVWRSTGSTPATQDRLDRVLASTLSRGDTVRR